MYLSLLHRLASETPWVSCRTSGNAIRRCRVRLPVALPRDGALALHKTSNSLASAASTVPRRCNGSASASASASAIAALTTRSNPTLRMRMIGPDRKQLRAANRAMHIQQRHLRQIATDLPTAVVAATGLHIAGTAQPGHGPAHHHRIGRQHPGNLLEGHRLRASGHVEQHMQHAGKAAIGTHAVLSSFDRFTATSGRHRPTDCAAAPPRCRSADACRRISTPPIDRAQRSWRRTAQDRPGSATHPARCRRRCAPRPCKSAPIGRAAGRRCRSLPPYCAGA